MQKNECTFRSLVIVFLLLVPLIVFCIPPSQPMSIDNSANIPYFALNSPQVIAGEMHFLRVSATPDTEKIVIIAYRGDKVPNKESRSLNNFYRWEYKDGKWMDTSGYEEKYIESNECKQVDELFYFRIKVDKSANPGKWTFKIIVDDIEVKSDSYFILASGINFFLSALIGVFEPVHRDKNLFLKANLICSERKKLLNENRESIEEKVDRVINRDVSSTNKERSEEKLPDFLKIDYNPAPKNELVKSFVTIYSSSKLKVSIVSSNGSFFKGGFGFKKTLTATVVLILLVSLFIPIITSLNSREGQPKITIINVQSYPTIGGVWEVKFNTTGRADLIIIAVNGTLWSANFENYDLKFLEISDGNKTLEYQWTNNSVIVSNYSSNETGYEKSLVLTPGKHILKFQFGDSIAYARNLATEHWVQTTTSDFNNGTKNDVNVSGGSFYLNNTQFPQNTTLVDDESFEGSWPPTGWTAENLWNKEGDVVKDGAWSADFDGSNSGNTDGNLITPVLNCLGPANVSVIRVNFWAQNYKADTGEYYLDYWDGSQWDQIRTMHDFGSSGWERYWDNITDSQYFVSDFQIRWRVVDLDNNEHVYVDLVNVTVERNIDGYESVGSLISEAHDTGRNSPDYANIAVDNSTLAGTTITTWVRAADTQANLSTATWYTDISSITNQRWVQWRINLTGDSTNTPTVNEVNISWSYDDDAPNSNVNAISPYWQKTTPLTVSVSASDTGGSGIKEVALYYNYSADNTTGWSGWALYGTNDTESPYSWSFTAPSGDGYYQFYSVAEDNENNTEAAPGIYDNITGVDTVDPSSQVDDISPYWKSEDDNPLLVNVSIATDSLSGVKSVTLYYSYSSDNDSWDPYASFGTDETKPWQWSFNFPSGKGHYKFYSIAEDNATNLEDAPVTLDNDTQIGYNTAKPSSNITVISPYWQNTSPITLFAEASDESGFGLKNVTLYIYNSTDNSTWNGPWSYGVDTDPWNQISWSFDFPNGTGYYRFYSIATDNATPTGVERFTGNDTHCGYDTAKPSSSVDIITPYWINTSANPIEINSTDATDDLSGVENVTLFYRYSNDNDSWGAWTLFGKDAVSPWNWTFIFPSGNGYYEFYSIANDTAGNQENVPATNDTICGYDSVKPTSQVDSIPAPYWKDEGDNPLTITVASASDILSGIKNITLYYRFSNDNESWGAWTAYVVDDAAPWSWSFNFPDGEDYYEFYSRAYDNASNFEDAPGSKDAYCGYDELTSFTASLWSEFNAVSSAGLTLTSSTNADGSTKDNWANADGGWTNPVEYWDFTIQNSTIIGPLNSVKLYIRHNQTGWINDGFKIQIYNGSQWIDVQTYSAGSSPPTSDTNNSWDIQILGIDTWDEIDDAIVRITGFDKANGEDNVRWYVDTVEIRIDTTYVAPVINSYDLLNTTGSKLNNVTGLINVNSDYYFSINITDVNGWADFDYIDIKCWYDGGNEASTYNQTTGGNLNMYLRYINTTGTASFEMLWPDDEAQIVLESCSETYFNVTTRIINISFKPLGQVRWAAGNYSWDGKQDIFNDDYSWNFNLTVMDAEGKTDSKKDEYGVHKYTSVIADADWVDVIAAPGTSDDSSIVTITYSSNYDYNISIYFEENLYNSSTEYTIPITSNVHIKASADMDDDITEDKIFEGIGEENAIDIINASGIFQVDGASQTVDVQFRVDIPYGTYFSIYTARVATKIWHD